MKRRKSIILVMLALIHTCALSLQGENSNGQISLEKKQVMKEYSLMRASLVYIARSIDSFFIENKIPSRYKQILSLIQKRLSLLPNNLSTNQKVVSSFLEGGVRSTDPRDVFFLPIQTSEVVEHDFDQINTLNSLHEDEDDTSTVQVPELQQLDSDAFYQEAYSQYQLKEVDLCAELEHIYDSFNQEFNELALLAIQNQQFNFDLGIHLLSIDDIDSMSTHIDWDSDIYNFVVEPDDVQTQIMFIGKDELDNDALVEKTEPSFFEIPGTIILDPIDLIVQESVALFDNVTTPCNAIQKNKKTFLNNVNKCVQTSVTIEPEDQGLNELKENAYQNKHEIAALKVLIDNLQQQIKNSVNAINHVKEKTDNQNALLEKQLVLSTQTLQQNISESFSHITQKMKENLQKQITLLQQQVQLSANTLQKEFKMSLDRMQASAYGKIATIKQKQKNDQIAAAVDVPSATVAQKEVNYAPTPQVVKEPPLPMYQPSKRGRDFKYALENDHLIRKSKSFDPRANWLQAQVKKELDVMLKELKMRTDFGEFGMQTVLELIDLEMDIIDNLLAGDNSFAAENSINMREKILERASPSIKWVYERIIDVASSFAMKSTRMRENVESKGIRLTKSLNKQERKLFLKRMQQVLLSYYARIKNMQRGILLR